MTLYECVMQCAQNLAFVESIDRLRGTDFSALHRRDPLASATGRDRDRAMEFAAIVYEIVWSRLPREIVSEAHA